MPNYSPIIFASIALTKSDQTQLKIFLPLTQQNGNIVDIALDNIVSMKYRNKSTLISLTTKDEIDIKEDRDQIINMLKQIKNTEQI